MKQKDANSRKCPLMSCQSIEVGFCYDLLDVSLAENAHEKAYYSDVERIAADRGVDVGHVSELCRTHGRFLKLDM